MLCFCTFVKYTGALSDVQPARLFARSCVKLLNQPGVKRAGCAVFALAQFLNNRKSFG